MGDAIELTNIGTGAVCENHAFGYRLEIGKKMDGALDCNDGLSSGINTEMRQDGLVSRLGVIARHADEHTLAPPRASRQRCKMS